MPAFEDPALYLADYGLACIAGAQQFMGILDQPAQVLPGEFAGAHTVEYTLTYISAQASLARNASISVGGVAYTVRTAPMALSDGTFSQALLSKT